MGQRTAPPDNSDGPVKLTNIIEHLWSIGKVCSRYDVSVDVDNPLLSTGLSADEVVKRRERDGKNELPTTKRTPKILILLKIFFGLFNLMLIVAGVLSLLFAFINKEERTQNLLSGTMLLLVVTINTAIEFYETLRGDSAVRSFESYIASKCSVVRENQESEIPAADLVPGDVVHLKLGDRSPADIILFSCVDLRIESSSLTGESLPVEKSVQNELTNPLEALNLVFSGSLVVGGEGYGIALRTGSDAAIAHIVSITDHAKRTVSPLVKELGTLVKLSALIAIILAIVMFPYLWSKGQSTAAIVLFIVGLFISIVPQGLPVCVPIVLESAHKRLAKTNVLVKDLYSIETLGSVTLVATDKTGTITRNQMAASIIWAGRTYFYASSSASQGLNLGAADLASLENPLTRNILEASALCSRAEIASDDSPGESQITGDATDTGLMRNAMRFISDVKAFRRVNKKLFEIPFNSELKYCVTIHEMQHPQGMFRLFMKGAPERVFKRCKYVLMENNQNILIDKKIEDEFHDTYVNIASKGHRVIAFAGMSLDAENYPSGYTFSRSPKNFPDANLVFYGLISLEDPPKHGVREAIGLLRKGQLKVIMITGDHPVTAEVIARRVNIITRETCIVINDKDELHTLPTASDSHSYSLVVTGSTLTDLSDDDWINILSRDELIFARTSPGHKLEIVKRAQACGHVVGVTGDGVNDAPALKKADVGISMNKSATEVPREAAKIILLDDNFSTLVIGIVEGRKIYKKLKRTVQYTLSHVAGEGMPLLLSVFVPLPHLLGSLFILFFDLCFELFVSVTYVWERKEDSNNAVMSKPPRITVPRSAEALKNIYSRRNDSRFSLKNINPFRKRVDPSHTIHKKSLASPSVLFWSYIFAGLIETCGCASAYFFSLYSTHGIKPGDLVQFASVWGKAGVITLASGRILSLEEQEKSARLGRLTWFYALCIQQLCNYFACKILDQKQFSFSALIPSKRALPFILLSCFLSLLLIIPQISVLFGGDPNIKIYVIFIPLSFGILLCVAAYAKVALSQKIKWVPSRRVHWEKTFNKLEMHPTTFTTR